MLIVHIIIALLSLLTSISNLALQKKSLITASLGLIGGTVVSGIALVIFGQASIVRVCMEGLLITGICLALVRQTSNKLSSTTT